MTEQEKINLNFTPKFPYKTIDKKNEVELSMGIDNGTLFITFLGSVSKKDWIHNFMFWKKPYKRMKKLFFVHAGFLKIYKICRDDIHAFINKNRKNNGFTKIQIHGHSLGGAIATLCYEDMMFLKTDGNIAHNIPVECITTGSPKVFGNFNSKFIKERMKKLVRYVNKNDGVPQIPFKWNNYIHVGREIKKNLVTKYSILQPSFIYDHSIYAYRDFFLLDREDNADNNELFTVAHNIYKKIFSIAKIVGVIGILLIATLIALLII
jgi:hypothetical protein